MECFVVVVLKSHACNGVGYIILQKQYCIAMSLQSYTT